jgi:hypothetical protein
VQNAAVHSKNPGHAAIGRKPAVTAVTNRTTATPPPPTAVRELPLQIYVSHLQTLKIGFRARIHGELSFKSV